MGVREALFFKAGLIFLLLRVLDMPNNGKHAQLSEAVQEAENHTSHPGTSALPSSSPESLVKLMRMFGQRSKEDLATDPKYWKSFCQVTNPDALDAIRRAKTDQCKRELTSVSCLARVNIPFPDFIPSLCTRFKEDAALVLAGGKHLGCYRDSFDIRILKGFVRQDWDLNSPALCTRMCSRAGFAFSGVQYGVECYCGHDRPDQKLRIDGDNCMMECPGGGDYCGGKLAMDVFFTGITVKREIQEPAIVNQVRVVFILTVSGKAVRQVRRLLRHIYRPHHFYYIHVDENSNWMFTQLKGLESLPNIKLASQRFKTFWASNTLLYLLLACFKEILQLGWNFDYVMNISESDFPVKPLEEFEAHLRTRVGRNFVATSGKEMLQFQNGQGMRKMFYNCDDHMYRVGDRSLPFGLQWVGGSDWVVLHKDFIHYLVTSDDALVKGLTNFYFYSIMAPESFFHTALFNSRFCETFENDNFRYINWNKGKTTGACSCTRSIDWCGCSPHNIRTETFQKLKTKAKNSPKMFFARKFEALVDQHPVNELEESIGGLNSTTPGWDSYWLNSYNTIDQGSDVIGQLALAVVLSHLAKYSECGEEVPKVIEVTSLLVGGHHEGEIIKFLAWGNTYELLTKPSQAVVIVEGHTKILRRTILTIQVGEGWDVREKIFRNMFGAFGTSSQLFLLVKFGNVEKSNSLLQLEYSFYDPYGEKQGSSVIGTPWNKGEELIEMSKLKMKLVPGSWSLQVSNNGQTVASLQYLVISEETPTHGVSGVSSFYPTNSLCSAANMSTSSQCLPGVISCHTTKWSSLVEDKKSLFP